MSNSLIYRSGRRRPARGFVFAAVAALGGAPARVEGATRLWTNANGTGVWSDGGNWSPAGVPPNPVPATDDLTFNGSTSPASTVDGPWTVSTLNFKANATATAFTLSGSPLTITRAINTDSQVKSVIQNPLILTGTDNGRGPDVDFSFVLPGNSIYPITIAGPVTGPARIRIGLAGRALFEQAPQNSGGPLASLDPGGPNYGLLVDDPFGTFAVRSTGPGNLAFFGDPSTAIGITGGSFIVLHGSFDGVTTIPNPFRIITSGSNIATIGSSNSNFPTKHRLNLAGPILLKGSLALSRNIFASSDTGVGGIGQDVQGTITVAGATAAIFDVSNGDSDSLISGNITQDGTPRTLTLGHDGLLGATSYVAFPPFTTGRVMQLSGDNTGLTGGIRVIGVTNPGAGYYGMTRFAYRFLNLASMGGGGNGNVFIGPNGTAGIGFPLTDAALNKIDPASTGVIGIDADSSIDIDLSAAGHNLPNVKLGTSIRYPSTVHYTGHITPFGNTYQFGGPEWGGSLSLDAANALSGPRGLNVGAGLGLVLNAPQSLSGPVQVSGVLAVNAAGAMNPNAPVALDGGSFGVGYLDNTAPAYVHNADITLGATPNTSAGIFANKTTGGAGYDLLLNGSVRGGSAQVELGFGGNGTIVLNGPNNDYAGPTTVTSSLTAARITTLIVNSSLLPSTAPLTLEGGRLGGTGSVFRPVKTDIYENSIIAPGGYPAPTGTLTIDSLEVAHPLSPIIYEFQFDAVSNDFLKILHDFKNPAGGTAILKLLPLAGGDALGETLPFLDVDGAIPNPVDWTVDASLAPQYAGSFVTFDPGSETYSVTLVPEPASAAMFLGVLTAGIARRPRRPSA